MKKFVKKVCAVFMAAISIFSLSLVCSCGGGGGNKSGTENGSSAGNENVIAFYEKVSQSQQYLDSLADDIYSYWYDAVYKDKYNGNIDLAIAFAFDNNSENVSKINENEKAIQSLYKEVRNSELSTEVKAVMSAYSDYYELVVNVSGSFKSYSENLEKYKKALASALKKLALEI